MTSFSIAKLHSYCNILC